MIHTVRGFSVVNETEIDVFLECSCFFCDPENVGNLIFGFSAGFSIMWTENFQMFKLGLERAEKPEIKLLVKKLA